MKSTNISMDPIIITRVVFEVFLIIADNAIVVAKSAKAMFWLVLFKYFVKKTNSEVDTKGNKRYFVEVLNVWR